MIKITVTDVFYSDTVWVETWKEALNIIGNFNDYHFIAIRWDGIIIVDIVKQEQKNET